MTFLNPVILFGLIAGAIPILIHLMNKRKLQTIEFSTLIFLKELQKNKIRQIKIKQWLLLLLRTLLILFTVLAFSRPALKGTIGIAGSHSKTTIVIILDNTASMNLHNEEGKFLSQAQSKANELINLMQEGDDAFFLRLSDIPNATTEQPTHDGETLRRLVNETTISFAQNTIEDALRLASRIIQQSKNLNKEIYILTDGQKSSLITEKVKTHTEKLFPDQIKFFVLPLAEKTFENVGIENFSIISSIIQQNKPISAKITIKNFGKNSVTNHLVSIRIDGKRTTQQNVNLSAGQTSTIEMSFIPSHSGFLRGVVELEDDELSIDNQWYFSVFVPEKINITIFSPDEKHSHYITTGLKVFQESGTLLSINVLSPQQLTSAALENTDVLILTGVKEFSSVQQQYIEKFNSLGGGILFFPNSDTAATTYQNVVPFIALNGSIQKKLANAEFGFSFVNIDFDFPVFQTMFEEKKGIKNNSIESPNISFSFAATQHPQRRTIISLTNNSPFLWEDDSRAGKIIGFSVPATTDWSDFPLRGIFLPLLHQTILYLATNQLQNTIRENAFVNTTIEFTENEIRKTKTTISSSVKVFDPENRETTIQSFTKNNSKRIFQLSNIVIPGFYSVISAKDTVLLLPVNVERKESNPELSEKQDISALFKSFSIDEQYVVLLKNSDSLEASVMQSRFGVELWRYFLLLAAIIAIIELIIAREPKQKSV